MQLKKIAVISAFPVKLNPGMITSDMSIVTLLKYFGYEKNLEIERFTIEAELTLNSECGLSFKHLTDPEAQLRDHALIFFWGDFLHCRGYHEELIANTGRCANHTAAENHIYKTLLFEGTGAALKQKTICFGNTIHINRARHLGDIRYVKAIKELYENAKLVVFRDPMSYNFGVMLAPRATIVLGADCAFFWQSGTSGSAKPTRRIGFSLGRLISKSRWRRTLVYLFITLLKKRLHAKELVNIDWLNVDEKDPVGGVRGRLSLINTCDIVVTDTYHCAVNSLREGVPVFCLGVGSIIGATTLDEKKKELLFMSLGLQSYYLFIENIGDPIRLLRAVRRCAGVFNDGKDFIASQRLLEARRNSVADAFGRALKEILEP